MSKSKITKAFNPNVEPKHILRLFLSADIVGSTPYKFKDVHHPFKRAQFGPHWFAVIALFYSQITRTFFESWAFAKETVGGKSVSGPDPAFWKPLGDEILFYKEITDYRQAVYSMSAWRHAVVETRKVIKLISSKLDVKATAWLANFPVANSEVIFRYSDAADVVAEFPIAKGSTFAPGSLEYHQWVSNSIQYLNDHKAGKSKSKLSVLDFVGPSMDNGFRLCGHATPRKFVLSMGLALMMTRALASKDINGRFDKMRSDLYYDGTVTLKGIRGGEPYPLFWLDTMADDDGVKAEDTLLRRSPALVTGAVIKLCESIIAETGDALFVPYIEPVTTAPSEASKETFHYIPKKHSQQMTALRSLLSKKE